MTEIAGAGGARRQSRRSQLTPGETADLPDGLGTVTFNGVKRFASLDVHHDPSQLWVLLFAGLIFAGLLTALFVPRRRVWVKATHDRRRAAARVRRASPAARTRRWPAPSATSPTHLAGLGVPADEAVPRRATTTDDDPATARAPAPRRPARRRTTLPVDRGAQPRRT